MIPSMSSRITPPYRVGIIVAFLLLITVSIFQPVRKFNFVLWDDPKNVMANPLYRPLPFDHLGEILTKPYFSAYIPVTRMVWADLADVQTGDGGALSTTFDPAKYHIANLVVHAVNVLLAFLILRLVLKRNLAAALGALLFAIHPLQVEPVAWVTGMKDVLSGFFSLVAIYLYLLFRTSTRERPQWPLYVVASIAFVLAVLSKSSAIVVPVIAGLLDLLIPTSGTDTPRAVTVRDRRVALGIWAAAMIPAALMASWADRLGLADIPQVALWQRPFVAGDTVAFYLQKLVFPIGLGPDYGRTPTWLMSHPWAYGSILIPLTLLALSWRYRSKFTWPLVALTIFIVAVLPVSGLVPFDFQAYSTVADRYTYLAMLGPALALACLVAAASSRAIIAGAAAVMIGLSILTVRQIPTWTDSDSLFSRSIQVNPRSWVSYLMLGQQADSRGDLDTAIECYRRSLAIKPQLVTAMGDLGIDLAESARGNPSNKAPLIEAAGLLEQAVKLQGDKAAFHVNLANVYYNLDRKEDAIAQYRIALSIEPNNTSIQNNLSIVMGK